MVKGETGDSYSKNRVKPSDNHQTAAEKEVERKFGDISPREFFLRMSPEESQLLLVRESLYDGSWEEMEEDMRHRLEKKPYIFRLQNRIEEDLARIRHLREYEMYRGVNLGMFFESETDDIEE
jgi:hypothetical protein